MYIKNVVLAVAFSAVFGDVQVAARGGSRFGGSGGNTGGSNAGNSTAAGAGSTGGTASTGNTGTQGGNNAGSLALNPNNVQANSDITGLGLATTEAGQTASATDPANFINFCTGKTLTNGQQVQTGSCNGIVMGDIPSTNNMISTIITNPAPGQDLPANQSFNVTLQVQNLVAGSFTNPKQTYYAAPQALSGGKIVGHTHVTIQTLGNNIAAQTPPDPTTFAFFKGINDAGDGNGGLTAVVANGLPAGVYRVCTMTSASNHQPVLMPVAQRGAQDDCTKFTVGQGSSTQNGSAGQGGGTGNTNQNGNTGSTGTPTASQNGGSSSQSSSAQNGNASQSGTASTGRNGNAGQTGGNQSGSSSRQDGRDVQRLHNIQPQPTPSCQTAQAAQQTGTVRRARFSERPFIA